MRNILTYIIFAMFSLGFGSACIAEDQQTTCIQELSKAVVSACNASQTANWNSESAAKRLCGGFSFTPGDGTIQSVMGDAKKCPGSNPVPPYQGWVCQFTIGAHYQVQVVAIYYSTCMG